MHTLCTHTATSCLLLLSCYKPAFCSPQNAHLAYRVGLQLHRGRNRMPVAPHQLSTRGARPHAGQHLILCSAQPIFSLSAMPRGDALFPPLLTSVAGERLPIPGLHVRCPTLIEAARVLLGDPVRHHPRDVV